MRRTLCTKERTEEVCKHLRMGQYIKVACALAGISEATFYLWRGRGEAEIARVEEDPRRSVRESERPYVEFMESCARARAEAEARAIMRIQKAAQGANGEVGDWKADAWFLERSYPKRWGRQSVEVEHSGSIETTYRVVTPKVLDAVESDD
jgi:transposase